MRGGLARASAIKIAGKTTVWFSMFIAKPNAIFFRSIRRDLFRDRLPQEVVDGVNRICEVWNRYAVEFPKKNGMDELCGVLATSLLETGHRLTPVEENLRYTTAGRIYAVWPSRFSSPAEAAAFVKNPRALACRVYNGRMGNREGTEDGWTFRGRGDANITGRDNYTRYSQIFGVDLVNHPDRALDDEISAKILIHGFITGSFTGHAAGDDNDYFEVSGRQAINGTDRANDYTFFGEAFMRAFRAQADAHPADLADDSPITTEKPITQSTTLRSVAVGLGGWIASLGAMIEWLGQQVQTNPVFGYLMFFAIFLPFIALIWAGRERILKRFFEGI